MHAIVIGIALKIKIDRNSCLVNYIRAWHFFLLLIIKVNEFIGRILNKFIEYKNHVNDFFFCRIFVEHFDWYVRLLMSYKM